MRIAAYHRDTEGTEGIDLSDAPRRARCVRLIRDEFRDCFGQRFDLCAVCASVVHRYPAGFRRGSAAL